MPKQAEDEGPTGVTLACWGDSHCGSTVGLQRPRRFQFEGGDVASDKGRRALYRRFKQYAEIVAERRKGRRLITVLMGDLIDGVHHGTKQLTTMYAHEQRAIFEDLWWDWCEITGFGAEADDSVYVLRGTDIRDTHGTASDAHEIGRAIGAVPYQEPELNRFELDEYGQPKAVGGSYAWTDLELNIHGQLVQLTHHAPTGRGTRAHTYGNTMRGWARSLQQLRDARRMPIPRYVIWAHKHTAHAETVQFQNGSPEGPLTTAVCVPAFQAKTHWVRQAIPLAMSTTIGGWWANINPDGSSYARLEYAEVNVDRKPEVIG